MNGLRHSLAVVATIVAVGWVFLVGAGDRFRASFGASENPIWKLVGPVVVAALLAAGLWWPDRRPLLHLAAVAALGLLVASLAVARESVFVATVGVCYAVGWLVVYYHLVWRAPVPPAA